MRQCLEPSHPREGMVCALLLLSIVAGGASTAAPRISGPGGQLRRDGARVGCAWGGRVVA